MRGRGRLWPVFAMMAVMRNNPNPDKQDLKRDMSEWEALCATSVVCAPGCRVLLVLLI